jgi:ATP-binding cassette subfamily F protein 3
MITISDLWKYHGDQLIFQEVSAVIAQADRIGLVGANGVGKTTLLETLAGEYAPDRGDISVRGGVTMGYLTQTELDPHITLHEFLVQPFWEQIDLEREMEELGVEMSSLSPGPELDKVMNRYGRVQAQFEHLGGYQYRVQINSVLSGLGFSEADLTRQLGTFSGGEQMRIGLARLLLDRPSLLILDEPTNHLDLEAVEWLEGFLANYPHAFIIVSHDRFFLDKVANRIWELEGHRLFQYRGNYSQYLPQRELRRAQIEAELERQAEQRAKMEGFIRKFGAGTRARQAKSLEKKLSRLPDLDRPAEEKDFAFRFEPRRQSGRDVLFLDKVCKDFNGQAVLKNISAQVKRGDRIALMGPNGSGKSTLLKILWGELNSEGEIRWGTGVEPAYFSQHITFSPHNNVLEELYEEHRLDLGILRSVLARFLFRDEEVFKPTSALSGGERNRLALAKLLLHRPNLLLLDEPTNHLDIFGREALEGALSEFSGTIIFASHDRYLIDKLATKIWYMENGSLREYVGNFTRFEERRRQERAAAAEREEKRVKARVGKPRRTKPSSARLAAKRQEMEAEIELLEKEVAELEELMASPELYEQEEESAAVVRRYHELSSELESKYEEWAELIEEKEEGWE